MMRYIPLVLLALVASTSLAQQEDPFATNIRPTEALSPEEERAAFRLPPGFEIQLVAAEPGIQKPMNLAFDARGRLWVTGSVEYPLPVAVGEAGRDTVTVLEDADGDGSFEKRTVFADGLNIPLGVYPYRDGAIVFTIPDILYLQDTDGDGRADKREKLYGPFGYDRDTHGLCNSFRRGYDGWLYACHGFNNNSQVAGADGQAIEMSSGNTFRMALDGGRIEHFTWGQTNPFGMAFDVWGDIYTADCHSKPLSLLLRGAYYPSLGKPHDGLGFPKPVMEHLHGSTAIAGVISYEAEHFPEQYRGSLFVGNVMTCRVHRDTLAWQGSTAQAVEQPDFLSCDDPWFRPVDLRLGPDGTLYIADFYNRIIGHYEVALDDPQRDRHRGRIWRVVYRGEDGQDPLPLSPDLRAMNAEELVASLDDPNQTVRLLATEELTDRIGAAAVEPLNYALAHDPSSRVKVHALWALHRLGKLDPEQLNAPRRDADPVVRTHVQRILSETPECTLCRQWAAESAAQDEEPRVRRAAADGIGRHPSENNVDVLLALIRATPEDDEYLRHTARMALRNALAASGDWSERKPAELTAADARVLASVVLALRTPEAGAYLLEYVRARDLSSEELAEYLPHAAQHLPEDRLDDLTALAQERAADDLDLQLALIVAVQGGLAERGSPPTPEVRAWGGLLAARLLDAAESFAADWTNVPLESASDADNPWAVVQRPCADGQNEHAFVSSIPHGERLTGALRSRAFAAPSTLRFYLCGHRGFPENPPSDQNFVRLVDAETGETLAQAFPPRDDTAQLVEWSLSKHAGRQAYLEIVDGMELNAYAWLAAGRFDPCVPPLPSVGPSDVAQRQQSAAAIVQAFALEDLAPRLRGVALRAESDPQARAAAARALVSLEPDERLAALASIAADPALPAALRGAICTAAAERPEAGPGELLVEAMRAAPERLQTALAESLSGNRAGAEALLALIGEGKASARLLRNTAVSARLLASGAEAVETRIEELTAALPPLNEEIARLLIERRAGYDSASPSISMERGAALFTKHCAACHQIAGKGTTIGPQLDGIGNRGLERLLEDVLDPNRNVDVAFQAGTFVMDDGLVHVGLQRRDEGETLVIADNQGKEIVIVKSDIAEQAKSANSLMPDNVRTLIEPGEFYDLLGYLLSQRQARPAEAGTPP